jgi:hypothetical protein
MDESWSYSGAGYRSAWCSCDIRSTNTLKSAPSSIESFNGREDTGHSFRPSQAGSLESVLGDPSNFVKKLSDLDFQLSATFPNTIDDV